MAILVVGAAGVFLVWKGIQIFNRPRVDVVSAETLGSIQQREDSRASLDDALGAPTPRKRERAPSRDKAAPRAYSRPWGVR